MNAVVMSGDEESKRGSATDARNTCLTSSMSALNAIYTRAGTAVSTKCNGMSLGRDLSYLTCTTSCKIRVFVYRSIQSHGHDANVEIVPFHVLHFLWAVFQQIAKAGKARALNSGFEV